MKCNANFAIDEGDDGLRATKECMHNTSTSTSTGGHGHGHSTAPHFGWHVTAHNALFGNTQHTNNTVQYSAVLYSYYVTSTETDVSLSFFLRYKLPLPPLSAAFRSDTRT